jgi:tetratricopeptide (TPR) repeat protein
MYKRAVLVSALIMIVSITVVVCRAEEVPKQSSKPQVIEDQQTIGLRYMREGKIQEAINIFRDMLKLNDCALSVYSNLANAYKMAGDSEKVIAVYKYGIEVMSKYTKLKIEDLSGNVDLLRAFLAEYYVVLGKKEEAVSVAEETLASDPKEAIIYYKIGLVYFGLGEKFKAEEVMDKGLIKAKAKNQKVMIRTIEQGINRIRAEM